MGQSQQVSIKPHYFTAQKRRSDLGVSLGTWGTQEKSYHAQSLQMLEMPPIFWHYQAYHKPRTPQNFPTKPPNSINWPSKGCMSLMKTMSRAYSITVNLRILKGRLFIDSLSIQMQDRVGL
jgi:hypothetical protein